MADIIVDVMRCERCNREIQRRNKAQKYCTECSEEKSRERSRMWAAKHPQSIDKIRKYAKATKSRIIQTGISISDEVARRSLADEDIFLPDDGWMVRFSVPYSPVASKNHLWSLAAGGGHLFKRQAIRKYQEMVAWETKKSLSNHKIFNNKIWIGLFVQKPNHRSDAINVLDTVCDGLKIGIGLDDRWFCIRQLDWEIVKSDPKIFISIYQRDMFDAQACSHCGRILPFGSFHKRSGGMHGIGRACRECTSSRRTHKRCGI